MQLHFIWIKHFHGLKKTGINLSDRFLIDLNKIEKQYVLSIKHNPDFVDDYIEEKNITNINAIIGKNGAGKSSVLRYIKNNLPKGINTRIKNDLFVYSTLNSREKENYYIALPESMSFELNNETEFNFEQKLYKDYRDVAENNCTFIYYQYLLEYGEDVKNWDGLLNISTSSMLQRERERLLQDTFTLQNQRDLLVRTTDLEFLHLQEVLQAIIFITHSNVKLPFEKPEFLFIRIDNSETTYFEVENSKHQDVYELLEKLDKIAPQHENTGLGFISNILHAIFINFLITERKYSVNNPYNHQLPINKGENRDEYIMRFFKSMENISYVDEERQRNVEIPRLHQLSIDVPNFIDIISDFLEKKKLFITNEGEAYLKIDSESEDDFRTFQQRYVKVKGMTSFLNFTWRSLSSGEQSYLSFMSRFYSLIHERSNNLKKNLFIMIDEGDTGYHPDWQRKFFKNTLQFLSETFKDHRLQIIFTSNTPFLTSDLLKSNILFTQKSINGPSVFLSKDNGNESTFAANIHTLFSDSFYMDGVLIGEYAKKKINQIITYINNSKTKKEPNKNYKILIDNIGEPVLRKKLQDMWQEKFGLQEELEILKKRIQEVEEELKSKQNKNTRKINL